MITYIQNSTPISTFHNILKWHDPRIKEILGKKSPPLQKRINVEATVRQANSMLDGAVTNQLIAL